MAALADGSLFFDTTAFASATTESFSTLPIINPDQPFANKNISKIPIFSDDDIALPATPNLKEFNLDLPETDPDFSELYPDLSEYGSSLPIFESSLPEADPNLPQPGSNLALNNTPLPELDSTLAETNSSLSVVASESPSNTALLDFANYDFDFDFDNTESSTSAPVINTENSTAEETGFDIFNFQDYDFDNNLFGGDEEAADGSEVVEEYDINDGWFEDYVEKTSEEKEKERQDFDEEWGSIVTPPKFTEISTFNIDLHPWYLWGPPLLCMGGLFLVFVPCMFLMCIDDKREIKGKQRHFGLPRFVKHIHREMYEKTASGEWKRVTNSRKVSCPEKDTCQTSNALHQSISLNSAVLPGTAKENVSYSEENEMLARQGQLNQSRQSAAPDKNVNNCRRDLDSVSNFSNKSNRVADRSVEESIEVTMVKDVDLGDGSPKNQQKLLGKTSETSANTEGAAAASNNWSMY